VFFADNCEKYDRKFKSVRRECLLTETDFVMLGMEKEKEGPNKGKFVKVVKRRIGFKEITGVGLSTLADDFFILHVGGAYDTVMSSVFKTEFVTVLSEKYAESVGRKLNINFSDSYDPSPLTL
jgi:myosin-1